jgi:hypothetical protein
MFILSKICRTLFTPVTHVKNNGTNESVAIVTVARWLSLLASAYWFAREVAFEFYAGTSSIAVFSTIPRAT